MTIESSAQGTGPQQETPPSDEALLGVPNKGKRKLRLASAAAAETAQNPGSTDDTLARALEDLAQPKDVTQAPPPAAEPVRVGTEQKENPLDILAGISQEQTVAGILERVRKAYDNEKKEEDRSYYTLILDTLEQINKKVGDPKVKIAADLIDRLSESYGLRETVVKILKQERKYKEAAPIKEKTDRRGEQKETDVESLNKIKDAKSMAEIITLVEQAGGLIDDQGTFSEVPMRKGYLQNVEHDASIYSKAKEAGTEQTPEIAQIKKELLFLLGQLPEKYSLKAKVIEILGLGELVSPQKKGRVEEPGEAERKQAEATPEPVTAEAVLAFINQSPDNMSVRAIMSKFGADEDTAKEYLKKSLGVETKKEGAEETTGETRAQEEETPEESTAEKIDLADDKIEGLNKAFDTPGFLEFLAKNPDKKFDIEDTNNAEAILKMYEAFQVKEQVSKGLKGIVIEGLNDVVGVGDAESVSCLDDYLNSKNYEDPEILLAHKKQLDTLVDGRNEIAQLQEQVKEITASLPLGKVTTPEEADLEALYTPIDASFIGPVGRKILSQFASTGKIFEIMKEDSAKDSGSGRIWRDIYRGGVIGLKLFFADVPYALYQLTRIRSAENVKNKEEARGKIEKITGEKYSSASVGKFLEKMLEQKEKSAQIGALDGKIGGETFIYEIFKERLAAELMKIEGISEGAGQTIKKTIRNVLSNKNFDLSSTEKAQDLLEKAERAVAQGDGLSFLGEDELAVLQAEIDKRAQEIVLAQIKNAFELNKKTKGPFTNIEKALKGILEKTRIGSKEGDGVRKTIKEALVEVAKRCNDPVISIKAKAFILTNKL